MALVGVLAYFLTGLAFPRRREFEQGENETQVHLNFPLQRIP